MLLRTAVTQRIDWGESGGHNVINVALLCQSQRLFVFVCVWEIWSNPGAWKGHPNLSPMGQPASALKLRQAVIINEETWANGQEMQRYWLGWLPCSKACRLAPAWWPVVSQADVCGGHDVGGGGRQLRCEARPPLAAVCHIPTTGCLRRGRERQVIHSRYLTLNKCVDGDYFQRYFLSLIFFLRFCGTSVFLFTALEIERNGGKRAAGDRRNGVEPRTDARKQTVVW